MKRLNHLLPFVAALSVSCLAQSQSLSPNRDWTASVSYSPDSSHILIGQAEQRRILQISGDYAIRLRKSEALALWFTSGVMPVMVESDPALTGYYDNVGIPISVTVQKPYDRPVKVTHSSVGAVTGAGGSYPIYVQYGRVDTYAFGLDPAGLRLIIKPTHGWSPVLSFSGGVLYAGKAIPSEADTRFNFQFKAGAGVEHRVGKDLAARVEYLYQHISNADIGQDPGIDSGTFRFLSRNTLPGTEQGQTNEEKYLFTLAISYGNLPAGQAKIPNKKDR